MTGEGARLRGRVGVMADVERLFDEALQLDSEQRLELGRRLLDTLEDADEEVDAAWKAEAPKRLASIRSGEAKGIP